MHKFEYMYTQLSHKLFDGSYSCLDFLFTATDEQPPEQSCHSVEKESKAMRETVVVCGQEVAGLSNKADQEEGNTSASDHCDIIELKTL